MPDSTSLSGQLLVSLPSMQGDYFSHTVTLLIEHNDEGAFGLVINKPLDTELISMFEEQQIISVDEVTLLETGPVEPNRLFFLHSNDRLYEGSLVLNDELTLSTSGELIDDIKAHTGPQYCFGGLGYAGWAGGQLEDEIQRDVWLVTPYVPGILFNVPFDEQPIEAAKSIGVDLNLISPNPGHG